MVQIRIDLSSILILGGVGALAYWWLTKPKNNGKPSTSLQTLKVGSGLLSALDIINSEFRAYSKTMPDFSHWESERLI